MRHVIGMSSRLAFVGVGLLASVSAAEASFTAKITADNHYALYAENESGLSLIGGNELGASGAPGTYNWSVAESYTFEASRNIYIAVWSDDRVAQGLLADIRGAGGLLLHTGVGDWEVMVTDSSKSDGSAYPSVSEIQAHVASGDANDLWMEPYVGPGNLSTTSPWGKIAGIDQSARWTWGNPDGVLNPLIGGADHAEYQIFRLVVPSPGAAVLACGGVLMMVRRRGR